MAPKFPGSVEMNKATQNVSGSQRRESPPPAASLSSVAPSRGHLSVRVQRKAFSVNGTELPVLQNLHLDQDRGAFVSLLGRSGCGKTTLLRLIAGLDTAYDGDIALA